MKLELDSGTALYAIRAYKPGAIVVNDEILTRSFILLPDRLIRDWEPQTFEQVARRHFDEIANLAPEIVLFGTGARLWFPAPELTVALLRKNIGLETMDTAAACRSYSILMSEGRRVAAALLMISA
ncbi:MAG TPA: Mth938-like domain-containing protein [Gammaproteobacteria bacterium]|nr:Mth938-like domain-containing protein [Gammaproteobacteria bacterium]